MGLVEVNATIISVLAFAITALMAALAKFGIIVNEDSANYVKRLVVLVLSLGAVIVLNYTQFGQINLDFLGDPVGSISAVVELVVLVWLSATGVYHSIWGALTSAVKRVFRL